jgi:hypothetical protein
VRRTFEPGRVPVGVCMRMVVADAPADAPPAARALWLELPHSLPALPSV